MKRSAADVQHNLLYNIRCPKYILHTRLLLSREYTLPMFQQTISHLSLAAAHSDARKALAQRDTGATGQRSEHSYRCQVVRLVPRAQQCRPHTPHTVWARANANAGSVAVWSEPPCRQRHATSPSHETCGLRGGTNRSFSPKPTGRTLQVPPCVF